MTHTESHADTNGGSLLRQVILGGQDGLVNVLGIVLGVAGATGDSGIVLVAGLAATAAESISMAAVAYTSVKAQRDFYYKELAREKWEIKNMPDAERQEIRDIYLAKGFKGKQLEDIVDGICSDEERWLDEMMTNELHLSESKDLNPAREGVVVGFSAVIGSFVPLTSFFFFSATAAVMPSLIVSTIVLFATGAYKGHTTIGPWWKTGLEMAVIGMAAAFIGYAIGIWAGQIYL